MNIIQESINTWMSEDYKEYSKELQSFFPSMYTTLKGTINSLFPTTTKRLPEEEELCKKWFKNLKVEVRLDNDFTRYVGTIPGISTVEDLTLIQWLPFLGKWFHVYKGVDYISLHGDKLLKAKRDSKGRIIFPSMDITILNFASKGFLAEFDEIHRMVYQLWNIGRWGYMKYDTTSVAFGKLKKINTVGNIPPVVQIILAWAGFILVIIAILSSSKNIYSADKFVRNLGYGNELAHVLEKTALNVRQNVSVIVKLSDYLEVISHKIDILLGRLMPKLLNVTVEKRVDFLKDNPDVIKDVKNIIASFKSVQNFSKSNVRKSLV